ncbi:MAG: hypothetical protein WB869_18315 [Candidatus Acidiferrales bacterium]
MKGRNSDAGSNLGSVIYWFDPGTYLEDSDHREMCCFTKDPNGYRVRVIYHQDRGNWTERFRGDQLICWAAGPTFDGAMIQTTMVGAGPNE